MAYATPTTPSEFAALIALIEWPENCNDQSAAITRIMEIFSALKLGWDALAPIRLYVAANEAPGQADWESAWVDTGRALPISGNVVGIWETLTLTPKDGGQFVWIEDAMRPTLARWWNGSSEFFETTPGMYSNPGLSAPSGSPYQIAIAQPLVLQREAWIDSWYAHSIVNNALDYAWRSDLDGSSDRRGRLRSDASSGEIKPTPIWFFSPVKITSTTLNILFRVESGVGGVPVVNTAQTRKYESGFAIPASGISMLGETSALVTEAIYLD